MAYQIDGNKRYLKILSDEITIKTFKELYSYDINWELPYFSENFVAYDTLMANINEFNQLSRHKLTYTSYRLQMINPHYYPSVFTEEMTLEKLQTNLIKIILAYIQNEGIKVFVHPKYLINYENWTDHDIQDALDKINEQFDLGFTYHINLSNDSNYIEIDINLIAELENIED